MPRTNPARLQKFHFNNAYGDTRFLTATDLTELLGVSRSTAYRIIQGRPLTKWQKELLSIKIYGEIPGWDGWQILPGELIDPSGYCYGLYGTACVPAAKPCKAYHRPPYRRQHDDRSTHGLPAGQCVY